MKKWAGAFAIHTSAVAHGRVKGPSVEKPGVQRTPFAFRAFYFIPRRSCDMTEVQSRAKCSNPIKSAHGKGYYPLRRLDKAQKPPPQLESRGAPRSVKRPRLHFPSPDRGRRHLANRSRRAHRPHPADYCTPFASTSILLLSMVRRAGGVVTKLDRVMQRVIKRGTF
ncbi:unnamed protein product, partial [Iphiclides podalirius]